MTRPVFGQLSRKVGTKTGHCVGRKKAQTRPKCVLLRRRWRNKRVSHAHLCLLCHLHFFALLWRLETKGQQSQPDVNKVRRMFCLKISLSSPEIFFTCQIFLLCPPPSLKFSMWHFLSQQSHGKSQLFRLQVIVHCYLLSPATNFPDI
jgi:hypothetical protein